ncbi:MAG: multicopper oxidase domain-containing protein [Bacteroidetes bacterium]|nr:multicopper oxidase domain-containing protein [Bacteroidota bacterium]
MKIIYVFLVLLASEVSAQNFINPLAIPPALTGNHFQLNLAPSSKQFYPGINTNTLGFNGDYLGPTLFIRDGDSVKIDVVNGLVGETTVHWHGLHIPSNMDGGPHTIIHPNTTWNVGFKVRNRASTCWYHPHPHMETAGQVTLGLAGLIIVNDEEEDALNLPRTYGLDDFPVVLQDRKYDANGNFLIEALGDSMLVNGTAKPFLDCPSQMIRLRILNGSNARIYNLGFSDNRSFTIIASDGSLLPEAYSTNRALLANGERVEIIVDLSNDKDNSVVLMSYGSELPNNIPGGSTVGMNGNSILNKVDFGIMQLNGLSQTTNPVLSIPTTLSAHTPWSAASAALTRRKELTGQGSVGMGNFSINNQLFNMNVINDTVFLDDIEIWEIANISNLAHPFHIHDVPFYVLSRNGNAPAPHEKGLKDVILVRPNETVRFITKFENYTTGETPYMYHCHNLVHEDDGMMGQFIVIEKPVSVSEIPLAKKPLLYPNPTNKKLYFNNEDEPIISFLIFDLTGKTALEGTIKMEKNNSIDVSLLENGLYIMKLKSANKTYHYKFLKE